MVLARILVVYGARTSKLVAPHVSHYGAPLWPGRGAFVAAIWQPKFENRPRTAVSTRGKV